MSKKQISDARRQLLLSLLRDSEITDALSDEEVSDAFVVLGSGAADDVRTLRGSLARAVAGPTPLRALVERLRIERWRAPLVSLAGGRPKRSKVLRVAVRSQTLVTLGLNDQIRIDISPRSSSWIVAFQLQQESDPTARGILVEPKTAAIEIQLSRASEQPASVKLGSLSSGQFVYSSQLILQHYRPGEEREWGIELAVREGEKWDE